ncbi:cardiolipin synthase [Nocardioides daeguensis]|uniref:Cardiolipin synthase n=1 Tax=Nocardioides daeguensis TaxID=908359 RepID=A0ABP6WDH2_9ACTN|nr:cardiolipin synthase [Nocardioides daeguensis]MBV6729783.1 cardiolipin synthase [Nocardioides daeguensis]MCR1773561.1 cardiolipin synthase [Nocardioides daeguensis]
MTLREFLAEPFTWLGLGLLAADMVLRVLALGVIPGNRKPSTGMAWLLLILVLPIPGFGVFLLFGSTHVGRRRHARQREVNLRIAERTAHLPTLDDDPDRPTYVDSVALLNRRLGTLPLLPGNDAVLLPDYSGSIAAMAEAVDAALDVVNVEFYITAWDDVTDPLLQAMARAAERGVTVRLLFDHLGSRGIPGYRTMLERLDGTGIQWRAMLPIQPLRGRFRRPDLRNHRKLLTVDGRVGFTGSQNLTEPGYNKPKNHALGRAWVELMVRLEGPVVAALDAVFAGDWYAETDELLDVEAHPASGASRPGGLRGLPCQVVPSGPGYEAENNLRLFTTLIYSAQRRISLTSPYFVPDESLLYAVTTAALRGVEVELFVSEVSDQFMVGHAQASYYRALLEAGVRIHRYPAPFVLHAKHFTIDDDVAVIGSSNMDLRSFALNYEVSLMLLGPAAVAALSEVQDHYRCRSTELTLEEWTRRPAHLRYLDNVLRLTAALQ